MDRNQVMAWVLIVLIVVGYVYYQSEYVDPEVAKQEQEAAAQKAKQDAAKKTRLKSESVEKSTAIADPSDSSSLAEGDSLEQIKQQAVLEANYGVFAGAAEQEGESYLVENNKVKLYINSKGGYIEKAVLKDYRTYQDYVDDKKGELVLFEGEHSFYQLNFEHQNRKLNTRDFVFKSSKEGLKVTKEGATDQITFRLEAKNGGYVEMVYTLAADDYMIDFDVNVVGLDRDITGANNAIEFQWEQLTHQQEKSLELERQNATVFYYSDAEGRDWLTERAESDSEKPEIDLNWISFKQQYFSTILIGDGQKIQGSTLGVSYDDEDSSYVKHFVTKVPVALSSNVSKNYKMYLGPNEYDGLGTYEIGLEEQLNLGWGIFRWVNQFAIYPLFKVILKLGVGVGIAIIVLTFAIKLLLFPITYKNFMSSAKMRVIKPHLEKINEQNKDADPVKKQQAVMALYKKTGVNPLAGCIPALLQMPILIALYRLFPTAMELRHQPFLWAEDLSSFDSIYDFPAGFEIPIYGSHISLFTILMAISMFFYMRYNQQMTPSSAASGGGDMQEAIQKNMKVMMNFMPVMMLFMFNEFASGLSFYYFLANVITIIQTIVIKKYIINEDKLLVKINEHMDKPMQKSKWQKKLEEIQAKQGR